MSRRNARPIPDYDAGYRDGENSLRFDVRYAMQESESLAELLEHLRGITGDPDLELPPAAPESQKD